METTLNTKIYLSNHTRDQISLTNTQVIVMFKLLFFLEFELKTFLYLFLFRSPSFETVLIKDHLDFSSHSSMISNVFNFFVPIS